jgi:hypothetical protein
MNVLDLEQNEAFQDAVLSTFHAVTHSFDLTPCVKLMENHMGKTFARMGLVQFQQTPPVATPNNPAAPIPTISDPPAPATP